MRQLELALVCYCEIMTRETAQKMRCSKPFAHDASLRHPTYPKSLVYVSLLLINFASQDYFIINRATKKIEIQINMVFVD